MKISIARVEVLVWLLIYGGMLVFGIGLALREFDPVLGHVLWIAGAAIAAAGAVLIAVRARMVARAAKPNPRSRATDPR